MFDFMLGPLGEQFWAGEDGSPVPRGRFHMDWSRVAYAAAAQLDPLHAFSYGIGDQQPAAITAAIGATQADALDTSLATKDALSRTCLLTHLGVSLDRNGYIEGADVAPTLVGSVQIGLPRLMLKVYHAERTNEESRGMVEDYPEGLGVKVTDFTDATAYTTHTNGINMLSAIRALPRPLPSKGGETYFRVTFDTSIRDGGATHGVITSYTVRAYGIAPAKIQPSEAVNKALRALQELQAQAQG